RRAQGRWRPACSLRGDLVGKRNPEHSVVRGLDAMDADGLDRGERQRLSRAQIEARPVQGTFDDAAVQIEVAVAQRGLRVAARVIKRIERSTDVEDRHRRLIDLDSRGASGRDVPGPGHGDPVAHCAPAVTPATDPPAISAASSAPASSAKPRWGTRSRTSSMKPRTISELASSGGTPRVMR